MGLEEIQEENFRITLQYTDTYVGGCDLNCETLSIYDPGNNKIIQEKLNIFQQY